MCISYNVIETKIQMRGSRGRVTNFSNFCRWCSSSSFVSFQEVQCKNIPTNLGVTLQFGALLSGAERMCIQLRFSVLSEESQTRYNYGNVKIEMARFLCIE